MCRVGNEALEPFAAPGRCLPRRVDVEEFDHGITALRVSRGSMHGRQQRPEVLRDSHVEDVDRVRIEIAAQHNRNMALGCRCLRLRQQLGKPPEAAPSAAEELAEGASACDIRGVALQHDHVRIDFVRHWYHDNWQRYGRDLKEVGHSLRL